MEFSEADFIEYPQYRNRTPYYPPYNHPNGRVGDQYNADLICAHIESGRGGVAWRNRIGNLRFVRLPEPTKYMSSIDTRAARQLCYEPIGVPMTVREFVQRVADLPEEDRVNNRNVAYEDLWWDCQGGHCVDQGGVIGKPYLKFLPPEDSETADAPDAPDAAGA